ncbi:DoxX family protein [Algoriphagus sp. AGSA1]|uniref:DoxX family protein n=1 Tax=Algoriphagus sp. AGSA1 TaxID=2907213 RepID=UPI001F356012|nr:DoxX family protein [Algoriphagus sp. AGSA1]MCE7057138.1 DoxX family protein [Algoriphagus sp. AGSA1]
MLHGPGFPPKSFINAKRLSWGLRILAAIILIQSLIFKFGAHSDSVMLFTTLGLEPFGRIGLGVIELIVAILILTPKATLLGAILGTIIMVGALGAHIFQLGIIFNNDGGKLFGLALVCFLACVGQVIILKNQLISFIKHRYAI